MSSIFASAHPEEYQADLTALLETGKTITDNNWLDDMGNSIDLRIAIQELGEYDPWMDEPLTEEERKFFEEANYKEDSQF